MKELKDIGILFNEFCRQADEFIKKEKESNVGRDTRKNQETGSSNRTSSREW